VFVDTSPNQSRRYCSDRCSSRANVAAYRARQRLVEQGKRSETAGTKAAIA
jgi:predicted RNA-binding Zn ribbon-like protein